MPDEGLGWGRLLSPTPWCTVKPARGVKAVHILLRGRVQGVGFRVFAERHAAELNVVGYVRNSPDGHVEVLAQGEVGALDRYRERLRRGPSFARVDDVSLEDVPVDPNLRDFRVRY